jgi:long-subunit acyl-CoA synthetase (AMP-forming)
MDVEGLGPGEESKESLIPGGGPLKVIGITSVNCEEWVTTDLASNLLGITSVPLYETLGTTMMALILG